MKKVLFLSLVAVATLASCKKDYTCACTFTNGTPDREITYPKTSKSTAQESCDLQQTAWAASSCELN